LSFFFISFYACGHEIEDKVEEEKRK